MPPCWSCVVNIEDLYRLLRRSHVQAQGVFDTIEEPLIVTDAAFTLVSANPAFLRTFGFDRDDVLGRGLFELGNGQWDQPDFRLLMQGVLPKSAAVQDYRIRLASRADGERLFALSARRLAHPDHNSSSILVTLRDISEAYIASSQKDILLAETQHRMKNLLAVLRALVALTQAQGRTAEEFRGVLLQRFSTFTHAQELLETSEGGSVSLSMLLHRVLAPFSAQARISGEPNIVLTPRQILPLSLVFSELCTNAEKYGGLSTATGAVSVAWSLETSGTLTIW